jgi:hypothetical protein
MSRGAFQSGEAGVAELQANRLVGVDATQRGGKLTQVDV